MMETARMTIEGMTCGGCVASVTRLLKALPGVHDVSVTLEPGNAVVTYDPLHVGLAAMKQAVEGAGYDVAG